MSTSRGDTERCVNNGSPIGDPSKVAGEVGVRMRAGAAAGATRGVAAGVGRCLSQVTSPTHGRQSTYSLIMQMDFAGLATRFQEAITARDAAGQVSDLQLVPLLRAISLDLKHLLRDIRQR